VLSNSGGGGGGLQCGHLLTFPPASGAVGILTPPPNEGPVLLKQIFIVGVSCEQSTPRIPLLLKGERESQTAVDYMVFLATLVLRGLQRLKICQQKKAPEKPFPWIIQCLPLGAYFRFDFSPILHHGLIPH